MIYSRYLPHSSSHIFGNWQRYKKPALPSNKRNWRLWGPKFILPSPFTFKMLICSDKTYKSAKLASNGHAKSNGRAASIEDEEDIEAGPAPPPEPAKTTAQTPRWRRRSILWWRSHTRREWDPGLYGGQESADIAPEKMDTAWLRKLALNFERRFRRMRSSERSSRRSTEIHGSEADLDADIKALSILAEHAELYGEFAKLGVPEA